MVQLNNQQNVTWLQINNWVPIVFTAVSLAISYGTLLTRLAVIEERLKVIAQQQTEILAKYSNVESRYGQLAIKVNTLETRVENLK